MAKRRSKRGSPKPRDYKAEYRARIERALQKGYTRSVARGHPKRGKEIGIRLAAKLDLRPGDNPRTLIQQDRLRVFGRRPPKKTVLDGGIAGYKLRLEELAKGPGMFDWLDEEKFIKQMTDMNLTEREAYSALFGSP